MVVFTSGIVDERLELVFLLSQYCGHFRVVAWNLGVWGWGRVVWHAVGCLRHQATHFGVCVCCVIPPLPWSHLVCGWGVGGVVV